MERILGYINNYFARTREKGKFKINFSEIEVKGKYLEGQYILIKGSILNDGIYKINNTDGNKISILGANNEEFEGVIYGLAIPKDVLEIKKELDLKENEITNSIYQSETFGNYSYSLATNENGQTMTAFDIIKPKLRKYRQMYETSLCKATEVK